MAATGGRPLIDQSSSAEGIPDDREEGASTEPVGASDKHDHASRSSVRPSFTRDDASDASHNRLHTLPPTANELSETTTFRETLVAARRFGATLNGLLSAVDVFARGVEGARTANDALLKRLDGMKEHVNSAEGRVRSLEAEVVALKAELAKKEAAFAAERQFLTDEQDEFLRALLEEHEEELRNAIREHGGAVKAAAADAVRPENAESVHTLREKVDTLRAERERARELVQRMRAQRDGAQAELKRRREVAIEDEPKTLPPSGMAHPTTPAPPPFAQVSRSPERTSSTDSDLLKNLGVVRLPRLSPPPAELAGVLHGVGIPRPNSSGAQRPPTVSLRRPVSAGAGPSTISGMPAARPAGVAPAPQGLERGEASDAKSQGDRPSESSIRVPGATGPSSKTNPAIPSSLVPKRPTSLGPNPALGTKGTSSMRTRVDATLSEPGDATAGGLGGTDPAGASLGGSGTAGPAVPAALGEPAGNALLVGPLDTAPVEAALAALGDDPLPSYGASGEKASPAVASTQGAQPDATAPDED